MIGCSKTKWTYKVYIIYMKSPCQLALQTTFRVLQLLKSQTQKVYWVLEGWKDSSSYTFCFLKSRSAVNGLGCSQLPFWNTALSCPVINREWLSFRLVFSSSLPPLSICAHTYHQLLSRPQCKLTLMALANACDWGKGAHWNVLSPFTRLEGV